MGLEISFQNLFKIFYLFKQIFKKNRRSPNVELEKSFRFFTNRSSWRSPNVGLERTALMMGRPQCFRFFNDGHYQYDNNNDANDYDNDADAASALLMVML